MTQRLTRLSDNGFSVTPLQEGWQPLRADECAALNIPSDSIGWVREVYLRVHGQPWIFARSVAARDALERSGLDLATLGSRSLGQLLFSDPAFDRGPIEVTHYPKNLMPSELAAGNCPARRSCFSREGLAILVAEVYLSPLWQSLESPPTTAAATPGIVHKKLDRMHPRAWDFVRLMRLEKPIGFYLLLWPTLWALFIAGQGRPSWGNVVIFILGVFFMRAAGCVINDFADRKFDGHVKRTKDRPLATGRISSREALTLFAILVAASFVLVLFTNMTTIALSVGGLALAACYPFMKRYTHYPQVVLGAAFSWGMPMAFTAQTGHLPAAAWLLYFANLAWTVAYDTYYAMTDRDDDLRMGLKSTAILFGRADRLIIALLQLLALGCLWVAGLAFQMGGYYQLGLLGAALCFGWEFHATRARSRQACFKAFLHNHWAGLAIFIGIVADYFLR